MKSILLIICSALIAACGTSNEVTALPEPAPSIRAIGTLSSSDDATESYQSIIYTRLSWYRYKVASLLRQGKIKPERANDALKLSDKIRFELDQASRQNNLLRLRRVEKLLNRAIETL